MSLWALPSFLSALLAISIAAALIWKRRTALLLLAILPTLGVLIWIHTINGFGALRPHPELWWKQLTLVGELIFPVTLGYVAQSLFKGLSEDSPRSLPWWWGIGIIAVPLVGVVIWNPTVVMQVDGQGEVVFVRPAGLIIWGFILLSLVVALSQFEQILRASRDPLRFQLKFVLIGLGGLAGMAIAQASQLLLLPVWKSSFVWIGGVATSISLLLIGFGLGRWQLQQLSQKIQVSHQALYTSLTFVLVGGYLIAVGIVAEIIQQTGWELREVFAALFVFGAALLLIIVIFSRQARLEIQQFVARHFFRTKYDYREKWVEVTDTFSSCVDETEIWDRYLQWLSQTFGAPRVTIWKRMEADGRFHQIRSVNTENPSPPIHEGQLLLVQLQQTHDPMRVNASEFGAGDLEEFFRVTQALVCVPIGQSKGHLMGFCTLSPDFHGKGYDHDDCDLLRVMAHHVAMLLLQFQLQEERSIAAKWEAVHKFSGFYLHDLKNLASSLSMVVQNADQYGHDPDFQASAMRTVKNTTQRIMELMSKLAKQTKAQNLESGDQLILGNLNEFVLEAIQGVNGIGCQPTFHPEDHLPLVRVQKESIKQLVLNLLLNARQAMGNQGTIDISTAHTGDTVVLEVADTGPGMSSGQVEHLFEPFRSSKNTGLGVGLFQCKRMVEDLKGTIRVESQIGKGTKIIVTFPVEYAEKK